MLSPLALAPGTRLGTYTIRSLLGAGGMGEVYEAVDPARNLRVALKVLQRLSSDSILRFKQEFRTLAGVAHPNLVLLYELVSDTDNWFFTMELVDGVDLLDYVWGADAGATSTTVVPAWGDRTTRSRPGNTPTTAATEAPAEDPQPTPADLVRVWRVFRQLADGLSAIHTQGKLHRDIKPSNVKVTPQGRVVVLDFGLIAEVRNTGSEVIGTLDFMSPEQSAGQQLHEASDWYSFGVVLYLALTGRLPYEGSELDVSLRKHSHPPALPSRFVTGVPPALERLTMSLLAIDPAARPPTAQIRAVFATTDPMVATRTGGSPVSDLPPRSLFIGRTREMRRLESAFEAVADGVSVVALVSGRSGIGKSALTNAFLGRIARTPSVLVFRGRCFQQESVPYKAVDAIVDALANYLEQQGASGTLSMLPRDIAALATIFPVLRRVPGVANAPRRLDKLDEQELRRRAFVALKELLARLGDHAKLILQVDDLQWGDSDSAALLTEIMRPPDAPALLLIGTYRSEGAESACVRALRDVPATHVGLRYWEIELEPLDDADAASLAASLLPAGTVRTQVAAIVKEAAGDPYFLQELATSAGDAGPRSTGAAPLTLDQTIRERLSRLPADLQRYMRVVAVAGRPVADTHAVNAAGLAPDLAILTTLRASHLVRTIGSAGRIEVDTYHDRIRESLVAGLEAAELRRLHGRLAGTLERAGDADDETLAIHYDRAGETGRAGPRYVAAAARAARALAFNHAVALYQRALEIGPASGEVRTLRVHLADALANAGRAFDAARTYETAADETPNTADRFELQRRAGYCYSSCGRAVEGKAAFNRALGHFGMRLPRSLPETFARLIAVQLRLKLRGMRFTERDSRAIAPEELARIDAAWSVGTGLGLVDIAPGWLFTSYALLLALKGGEPKRVARALSWEAATMSSMSPAGLQRAAGWLRTCDELAGRLGDPHLAAMTDLAHGIAAYSTGDWAGGVSRLTAAADRFEEECPGSTWERSAARGFLFRSLFNAGQYRVLRPQFERARQTAVELGDERMRGFLGAYIGPNLALVGDRPDEARDSVQDSIAGSPGHGFFMNHAVAGQARPMIHLYGGDAAAAEGALTAVWPDFKKHHFLSNMVFLRDTLEIRSRIATATAARTRSAAALKQAECDCRALLALPSPYLSAHVMMIRGAAAKIGGQDAEAARRLAEAADGFDTHHMRAAAACARYVLGSMTNNADLSARAAALLHEQSVTNIDRFARMLIPGYLPSS
jgi:eukaryotic-like serine/threonine-protein kinase